MEMPPEREDRLNRPLNKSREPGIDAVSGEESNVDEFFTSEYGDLPETSEIDNSFDELELKETADSFVVEVEMGSFKEDEMSAEIVGDRLVVRGRRTSHDEDRREDLHHIENEYDDLNVSAQLGPEVDPERMETEFDMGVMRIRLGKAKKDLNH